MSYHHIPLGKNAPQIINAVVENPQGCPNKYEYDEEMDEIRLDRVLHSPVHFPVNYSFIPQTRADDGDHLDALVICSTPLFPGCVVSVRVIGAVDMEDEAGQDWKILCVAEKDPRSAHIRSVDDLTEHFRKEITHFFEEYKKLEDKWMRVKGWVGIPYAHRIIEDCVSRFLRERH